MNKGTATKLISLLQSGQYKPLSGQLRYEDSYCPLGVLADFLDPTLWKPSYVGYDWGGEKFFLPDWAMKKCKLKSQQGKFVTDNGFQTSLVDMDSSHTFAFAIHALEKYHNQM